MMRHAPDLPLGTRRAGARSDVLYALVRAAPTRAEVACRLLDMGDVTRGGCSRRAILKDPIPSSRVDLIAPCVPRGGVHDA
jgi:hypothetical protein